MEEIAIFKGLKHILKSLLTRIALGIEIHLYNLKEFCNIKRIFNNISQQIFKQFKNLAKNWSKIRKKLIVQWIASHIEIDVDKLAD